MPEIIRSPVGDRVFPEKRLKIALITKKPSEKQ
jgi:hypothetical protein